MSNLGNIEYKFRLRFNGTGWVVQYSRFGILWKVCGSYEYCYKNDAEITMLNLLDGKADESWYAKRGTQ